MPLLTWEEAQPYLQMAKPSGKTIELDKWHYARTLAAIEEVKTAPYLSDENKTQRIETLTSLLKTIEVYLTASPDLADDGFVSAGNPIYRVTKVSPLDGRLLEITWENGVVAQIDLSERLAHRAFAPVDADDDVFRSVQIGDYGWHIHWPSVDGAEIPSARLGDWAESTKA